VNKRTQITEILGKYKEHKKIKRKASHQRIEGHNMRAEIVLDKKDLEFFEKAMLDSKAKKNIKKLPPKDYWKKWDNSDFLDFMVECICSSQQNSDSKSYQKFLGSEVYRKRLWAKPEGGIEIVLRKYGVRFPKRKASEIAANRSVNFVELMKKISKDHPSGKIDEERKARRTFLQTVEKGFGLKQASHFLMYVGYSTRLVPIDSRWINSVKKMGIDVEDLKELGFLIIEEAANKAADTLSFKPNELDVANWTVSGN
jgi:thermostable 8-oxoguanine DNA glycosylase